MTDVDVLPAWWVSWYSASPTSEFELHSPWWVSGYAEPDLTIFVAAVRAADEEAAYALVDAAYDHPPGITSRRFCEPLDDAPWVLSDRWKQAAWMAWGSDGKTCACPNCGDDQ